MKRLLFFSVFSLLATALFAKNGYRIEIKFNQDVPDDYIFLAHYFAKPLPTIYKTDSAKVINKRTAVIESKDSVLGGIYLILFANKGKYVEFILDNGNKMEMTIDTMDMPANISFKNSPENTRYVTYEKYLMEYGKQQQELMEGMKEAGTAADSQALKTKSMALAKELSLYRKAYAQKHPGTYLANVFKALAVPEVPPGPHYLEDKKTIDSNFAYNYYKKHYWDDFAFNDDRLMYSPVYDAKLDEYFNRLVLPLPDTFNAEADQLLAKTRGSKELFKYSLHWLARNAESSKVMGMDEVFVHLVEKYYMKGDAYWLDSAGLAKYEDRAKKIAPNVLGNIAPDIIMQDIFGLQDIPLHSMKAPYTLLVFWSMECGHCVKEMPQIDSVYKAVLKQKGVKVYAVSTEGELTNIQKKVADLGLLEWTNVVDAHNNTGYRALYDIYSTPKVYLLDADKKIVGKGLDHSNIVEVLEWLEKKAK